ncbi:MAG: hypothetical protein PHT69_02195 [Bacteroidales bacterium]|nr:hypothetical protein [Bacteroidales bacterium]
MSKIIELAKKLKALADRGEGGEKVNAENKLQQLMMKHGITTEEIEGEQQLDYFFNIKTIRERKLWMQVVALVNREIKKYGEFPSDIIEAKTLPGNYMIICTVAEYIEIQAMFDFYKNLYDQEEEIFYTAFLHTNNLLLPPKEGEEVAEYSKEERDHMFRAVSMAKNITKATYRKQLETKVD